MSIFIFGFAVVVLLAAQLAAVRLAVLHKNVLPRFYFEDGPALAVLISLVIVCAVDSVPVLCIVFFVLRATTNLLALNARLEDGGAPLGSA